MNEQKRVLYHRPKDHRRSSFPDLLQKRAHRRLKILMWPTLAKIVWYHIRFPLNQQISELGQGKQLVPSPLPDEWAWHAADYIGAIIKKTPIFRRRTCYWRSQLLYDLLPRFGFRVILHAGASISEQKPGSHLWVTLNGKILADTEQRCSRFEEMATFENHA